MDYIKIRFGNAIEDLECRFEQTLEEMFCAVNPVFKLSDRTWNPSMDMYETPEEIMIIAEIAGVDKEELEVGDQCQSRADFRQSQGGPAGEKLHISACGNPLRRI